MGGRRGGGGVWVCVKVCGCVCVCVEGAGVYVYNSELYRRVAIIFDYLHLEIDH